MDLFEKKIIIIIIIIIIIRIISVDLENIHPILRVPRKVVFLAFWNLKIKTFHMEPKAMAIFHVNIVKLGKDGHQVTLTGCFEKPTANACMSLKTFFVPF